MTKTRITLLAAVAAALIGIGLYLFAPWALVVDRTVDEAAPVTDAPLAQSAPVAPLAQSAPDAPAAQPAPDAPAAQAATLATGTFISHEHATSGTVQIIEGADGTRTLRIEGLDTSNGPDLKVWLTDAPVIDGRDGWGVFDDGRYVNLGGLKGNQGSQNYVIPADVDLTGLTSVSIWCDRFNVSFGAAELSGSVTD